MAPSPMPDAPARTSGVRFPPPLVFALGLVSGWLLGKLVELPTLDERVARALSVLCFIAGAALLLSSLGLYRRAHIDPLPWRPTSALTMRGPYRFTRNPMYLGMAVVYAGFA